MYHTVQYVPVGRKFLQAGHVLHEKLVGTNQMRRKKYACIRMKSAILHGAWREKCRQRDSRLVSASRVPISPMGGRPKVRNATALPPLLSSPHEIFLRRRKPCERARVEDRRGKRRVTGRRGAPEHIRKATKVRAHINGECMSVDFSCSVPEYQNNR